ncbi:hypothetical protein IEQ34_018875 [Dendrobium chrysotoxum]|uniref:TTI1 N-terminal TPR domain-containing protein n=1 Tax=Dendrobium chrysotoxum TaxID=161865 RepID=A0AAV7G5A5_DENCH|nr:hypothetical protein IEQ34_018875 [Dendrobium chrysotoxum]
MVSGFTKSLLVTKNMISGAAGNVGSIEHAVLGLSKFLIVVLMDNVNLSGLQMSTSEITCSYQLKKKKKKRLHETFSGARFLYVQWTKDWVDQISTHVDKLWSATFPHLCVHPAEKVRKALVDGIMGLLSYCTFTLQRSSLMLLGCLCVLVCDDLDVVSSVAEDSLNSLFISGKKILRETDFSKLFMSLLERVSKMVLRSEEVAALSHARRLLVLIYYACPELVDDHFFGSPMKAAHFLDFFYAFFFGSIDKLISSKPLSVGNLLSIAELRASSLSSGVSHVINGDDLPLSCPWKVLQRTCPNLISGAIGNVGSIEHAVLGLSKFLIVVLMDNINLSGLQMSTSEITCSYQKKNGLTQTVLDVIRQLPTSLHNQSEDSMCQLVHTQKKKKKIEVKIY